MKEVVAAFNQEKALVGAFYVLVQLHRLIVYTALVTASRGVTAVTPTPAIISCIIITTRKNCPAVRDTRGACTKRAWRGRDFPEGPSSDFPCQDSVAPCSASLCTDGNSYVINMSFLTL